MIRVKERFHLAVIDRVFGKTGGDHVWIKQHLGIKSFFGTCENADKTQVWIAVSVYVLVAIARKRPGLDA